MKRIIFSLLAMVLLIGCSNDDSSFEQNVAFTTIAHGSQSYFYESNPDGFKQVFKDAESWNNFMSMAGCECFSETEIDFNQFEVIAIVRNSEGHGSDVKITEIKETKSSLKVMYTSTDFITSVISRAYHVVKIPKKNKPDVQFVELSNL
ncbi:MAG: hypothetical protein Q4B43_06575 [Bacteroidota bacterium]|nr:hypothetical protein [Bacteroidota bacterium]